MPETTQFEILTNTMLWHKHGKWNNINPFFHASKRRVLKHMQSAKEVYKDVFNTFISSHVILKAKELGVINGDSIQNLTASENGILDAIQEGKIHPIPGYEELKKFKC